MIDNSIYVTDCGIFFINESNKKGNVHNDIKQDE